MRNTLCEFLTFADSRLMRMQASVYGSLSARKKRRIRQSEMLNPTFWRILFLEKVI